MIHSKDIYHDQREAELQQRDNAPTLEELDFNRNRYCSGCNINWSHLPTQEDEGDEQYEYCPVCRTDANLEDGRDGDAYFISLITGKISDPNGKQLELPIPPSPPPVAPCDNPFNERRYRDTMTAAEQLDNRAIEAYFNAYDADGLEAAEQAYLEVLRKG